MQKYPEKLATAKAYKIYDSVARDASKQIGPDPPQKYKVSLEKFLRYLSVNHREAKMNIHWKSQDGNCHFVSIRYVDFLIII